MLTNDDHLKLIEVKAKSFDKDTLSGIVKRDGAINATWKPYIADVAFQKWVLQKAYPNHRISSYLMLMDKDSLCPTDGLNQKFILEKDSSGRPCVKKSDTLCDEDLSVPLLKEINVDDLIEKIWNEVDEKGIQLKNRFQEFSHDYFNGKKSTPIPKKACGCAV